jgi:HD-like signal output (HDOD) protein
MNDSLIDETQIASLLNGVTIPPRPAALAELSQDMQQPEANGVRIAELIGRDPGLASAVLKVANFLAADNEPHVATVAQAVDSLGFGPVLNIVVGVLLKRSVGTAESMLGRFWDNSALCAAISASFASIVGYPSDTAYTFGLLFDCGIPLMSQRFDNYKAVLIAANSTKEQNFTAVEDAQLGTNHAVVGYFLARSWGLPKPFAQAVLLHHELGLLTSPGQIAIETGNLIATSVVASYVAGKSLRGAVDPQWERGSEAVATWLGYTRNELEEITDGLIDQFSESSNMASLLD